MKKQAHGRVDVEAAADKLDAALSKVASADAASTTQSSQVFNLLSSETTAALNHLKPLLEKQLLALLGMQP